ncbi:MAG: CPBP family intramembrane glutamic endopeptidase [Acidimicrobiales bacterium]
MTPSSPASLFAASLVGQQLGQGVAVDRVQVEGLRMRLDWGWAFEWRDLWIGPLTGLAALVLAVVVGALASTLVGGDEVSNTSFLDDAEGTLSYWVLIAGVAIGAPLTEELLFRGLILRALEKRADRSSRSSGRPSPSRCRTTSRPARPSSWCSSCRSAVSGWCSPSSRFGPDGSRRSSSPTCCSTGSPSVQLLLGS